MKKLLLIPLVLMLVFGCASLQDKAQFYEAQKAYLQALQDKPLVDIKAVPGKAIENLERVIVYMPTGQIKDFKQFSEDHPAWRVLETTVRTAGYVGLGLGIAHEIKGMVNSSGGGNTTYNQTVSGGSTASVKTSGNMTTGNISGSTVGGMIDQTGTPTVVDTKVVYAPDPVIVNPVIVP